MLLSDLCQFSKSLCSNFQILDVGQYVSRLLHEDEQFSKVIS